MTLEGVLKEHDGRLTVGRRWLVWNEGYWIVMEQKHGQRVKMVDETRVLGEALKVLVAEV
jgi:uncharacterized protein YkwD